MKDKKPHIVDIYNDIQNQHKGKVLLFQIGTFYEIFGENAKKYSKVLGIKQTSKKYNQQEIPMCGFPIKSKSEYIKKLLSNGVNIAIINEEKNNNHKFLRTIADIITPSTSHLNIDYSHSLLNSYIAAIDKIGKNVAMLFVDVSTGEAFIEYTKYNKYHIIKKLSLHSCSEIVISDNLDIDLSSHTANITTILQKDQMRGIDLSSIRGIGNITTKEKDLIYSIFSYIKDVKNNLKFYIHEINKRYNTDKIYVPFSTISNLMIVNPFKDDKTSLLSILDQTITPLGKRYITNLLTNASNLQMLFRQDFIEFFINHDNIMNDIKSNLFSISDIDRIIFRILNNSASYTECISLIESIYSSIDLFRTISSNYTHQLISNQEKHFNLMEEIILTIYSKDEIKNSAKANIQLQGKIEDIVLDNIILLKKISIFTGMSDAILSMANVSKEKNWVKPMIVNENIIEVTKSFHPIYQHINPDKVVDNDFYSHEGQNQMIITGPNMAGKSIYIKQIGLICFMAQIGCFVPCESMKIGKLDAIIARIGASDDLTEDKSTFYVEMEDISEMTDHSTNSSLCLIDEIGRGTSFEDGAEISSRIIKYLAEYNKPHLIISTHITKLTEISKELPNIENYHFQAQINQNMEVAFDYKIRKGIAKQGSFAKNIAKMLQLPYEIWKE